jgi:hypothetical protein
VKGCTRARGWTCRHCAIHEQENRIDREREREFKSSRVQEFKSSRVQEFKSSRERGERQTDTHTSIKKNKQTKKQNSTQTLIFDLRSAQSQRTE